ncbi:MAG: hypothetical protein AAGA99_11660 [Actinomycetota bacterium]
MTTTDPRFDDLQERQIRELAEAIAARAQAIASGTLVGPRPGAVRQLVTNIETLDAWVNEGTKPLSAWQLTKVSDPECPDKPWLITRNGEPRIWFGDLSRASERLTELRDAEAVGS